jgi:ABC-type lipoprotein export system ATPase subunit
MSEEKIILEFEDVTAREVSRNVANVEDVSFRLESSGLIAVLLGSHGSTLPLFDLAEGLLSASSGSVRFMDESWHEMSFSRQAMMRGKIGRVFDLHGWVSNLTVLDNVLLSTMHHSKRDEDDVRAEADQLARTAGLSAISEYRPDLTRRDDLRRSQWVRAFLGDKSLVLLDQPEVGLPESCFSNIAEMVHAASENGTAVIWTTLNTRLWESDVLKGASRYEEKDSKLIAV